MSNLSGKTELDGRQLVLQATPVRQSQQGGMTIRSQEIAVLLCTNDLRGWGGRRKASEQTRGR